MTVFAYEDGQSKLNFLAGEWKTVSEFTSSGMKVEGNLTYYWVIGGEWLHCRFIGNHPDRPYWEAVAMMRFDSESGRYVSVAFFNDQMPVTMYGIAVGENTIRFERTIDDGKTGIDYTDKGNGTVYQENWIEINGERTITLKTDYTAK
jgi:hypothetical protein